jgi:hypothetical protein
MPLVLDGTNGVSGVDGTASNPSYEGTDSNTGIFFPAADTVAIGTGGTERVRVVSAGDVGVGTSTPATISNRTVLSINNASNGGALNLLVNGTETLRLLTDNSSFGYVYNVANQPLVFGTNNTERMRLDASGKLLVGGTSAIGSPYIQSRTTNSTTISGSYAWNSTDQGISLINESSTTGTGVGITMLGGSSRNSIGAIYMVQETGNSLGALSFYTGGGGLSSPYAYERARITSGGDLLVGKTVTTFSTAGINLATNTIEVTRSADKLMALNRLTSDGALVDFYQDGTLEGNISVSGTTVSYNGGHLARWSQLLNGQRDESILKGTVLSNLDEMCEWLDSEGNPLPNEQLNRMKVSDVEGDTNVAGVFVNWDNDDQDNPYDMNIAMTGDMIIRIAQGVTVQKGDLLMSAGDGTAKPQGDDIVRSKTVAKVTSNHVTCTYDDGSYCVPCVLMAC